MNIPLDLFTAKNESIAKNMRDEVLAFLGDDISWQKIIDHFVDMKKLYAKHGRMVKKINHKGIRLAKKIFEQTNVKVFPLFERVYAGYWQRSAGAWSWAAYMLGMQQCGSQWPMDFLLKQGVGLEASYHYFWHIDPDKEGLKLFKSKYDR